MTEFEQSEQAAQATEHTRIGNESIQAIRLAAVAAKDSAVATERSAK